MLVTRETKENIPRTDVRIVVGIISEGQRNIRKPTISKQIRANKVAGRIIILIELGKIMQMKKQTLKQAKDKSETNFRPARFMIKKLKTAPVTAPKP